MDYQTIKGKKILVTGSSGFIGRHLCRRLEALGANTIRVSRNTDAHVGVTDKKKLNRLFDNKPDIVFHLAGEALVERGHENPYETLRTNVMGTLNILELSRAHRTRRIIVASTAHVYGAGKPPFCEDDPPRPSRPYETSKTATDLLAQSYADSFGLPVVIPRFVNIYGPEDRNYSRVVPKALTHILHRKAFPIWGGSAKREYLYIDDAIEAYLKLALMSDEKLEKNRIFNFGTGVPISVSKLVRTIESLTGVVVRMKHVKEGREGEIITQYVSWEKAKRILNWKPRVSLKEGLTRTIDWYKAGL